MVTAILPLTMTGAVVKRRGKTLLGPVDLTVSGDGMTMVLGPNGAGKTTLLRALHGLEKLAEGQVHWAVPTAEAEPRQGFVFQTPIMLRRSVRENLIFPLTLQGIKQGDAGVRSAEWATRIGLGNALDQQATQLSGGEKQKLALARALIRNPQVLFLDEPCANLDGRSMREIETLLRDAQGNGTRILMSTHDLGQARRLASDIVFLVAGKIIENTSAKKFFEAPSTPQGRALLNGDIIE